MEYERPENNRDGTIQEHERNPERLIRDLWAHCESLTEEDKRVVEDALRLAERAHAGQFRDDGETPFVVHPLRVAIAVVDRLGRRDAASIAKALLHDVVEDTDTTLEEIAESFGDNIAKSVGNLSHDTSLPRREMFKEYYARLQNIPEDDLQIKLMDRLDNLRSLRFTPNPEKRTSYLRQTEREYLPLAEKIDPTIAQEMRKIIADFRDPDSNPSWAAT